jgi:Family of unknown function (DUF5522)
MVPFRYPPTIHNFDFGRGVEKKGSVQISSPGCDFLDYIDTLQYVIPVKYAIGGRCVNMSSYEQDNNDWEILPNGLYVATRGFLIRRGYCCANQCRNCPYINWRNSPTWQPAPAEAIKFAEVSPKAIQGAKNQLAQHTQQLAASDEGQRKYHQRMIEHYQLLLEHWGE